MLVLHVVVYPRKFLVSTCLSASATDSKRQFFKTNFFETGHGIIAYSVQTYNITNYGFSFHIWNKNCIHWKIFNNFLLRSFL